jgi:hypothetical protein
MCEAGAGDYALSSLVGNRGRNAVANLRNASIASASNEISELDHPLARRADAELAPERRSIAAYT